MDNMLPDDMTAGLNVMEWIQRKSYSEVVIDGVRMRVRVFVGDLIVRKTDRVLIKGDDVVVCFHRGKNRGYQREGGPGKGGSILVHVGTNKAGREDTTAVVRKYRQFIRTLKPTRVEQVTPSGILPIIRRRGQRYRNCQRMAINMLVQKLCREEEVGFVGLRNKIRKGSRLQ